MEISVIIPTLNRRDVLRRVLRLYDRQAEMSGRFETVVVDDGSNDGTSDMVEAMRPALSYPVILLR